MFNSLCYIDPYKYKWKTKIVKKKGNLINLKENYFFPSSGGQEKDDGVIFNEEKKAKVIDVIKNGGVWIKVDKDVFEEGEEVNCYVDWEKRYELMKGHTAEHLFFGMLKRVVKDIGVVKVNISKEKKSLFVTKEVSYDDILKAEKEVNNLILKGVPVNERILSKEEVKKVYGDKVRIKEERVGEIVRVIEIGDYDYSACSGLHVKNTREIEAFAVKRVNKNPFEITFEVSKKAIELLLQRNNEYRKMQDLINFPEGKGFITIKNLKEENEKLNKAIKELAKKIEVKREAIGNFNFYYLKLPVDLKLLIEKANKIADDNAIILFENDNSFLIKKGKNVSIDFNKFLKENNIKGGGKEIIFGKSIENLREKLINFVVKT